MPPAGALVKVHYEGYLFPSDVKFDSSVDRGEPFTFKLGVGQVIQAWDTAVATMQQGEVASICCKSDYAYGWEGSPPKIPRDATLRFEINLISWEVPELDKADMTVEERTERAQVLKDEGTVLFKAQQLAEAAAKYQQAAEYAVLQKAEPASAALLTSCLLNEAQCHIKLQAWEAAVNCCRRVLEMEPNHAKALFRRGVALTALERYDEAKTDLKQACLTEPKSREMREQFELTKAAHAAKKKSDAAAFGGMFAANSAPSKKD